MRSTYCDMVAILTTVSLRPIRATASPLSDLVQKLHLLHRKPSVHKQSICADAGRAEGMDNRAGSRLIGAAARLYHGARAPRALARLVRRAGPAALTVHASRPLAAHSNGRRRSSERARRGSARRSARGGWVIGRIPLRFLYGPTRFARTGAAKARPSSWSGRRGSFAWASQVLGGPMHASSSWAR